MKVKPLFFAWAILLSACAPEPWPYSFPKATESPPTVEEKLLREQQETNRLLRELQRERR